LESLELTFFNMSATLPPSWGADPAVLPALQELRAWVWVEGGLPAEWARGFRNLTTLSVVSLPRGLIAADPDGVAAVRLTALQRATAKQTGQQSAAPPLPPEWASSFPRLEVLTLSNLGLTGSLPQSWLLGGFPSLTIL